MPKFGWCKFAEDQFGVQTKHHTLKFRMYGTVPLGLAVRRTMNKKGTGEGGAVTYRVRRGNGSYGSVDGKIYQDKYDYPEVTGLELNFAYGASRNYAVALEYWQEVLTDAEKKEYNRRAAHGWQMSGYNLFLKEALRGEYHMFVDRGDPASYDFVKTDFTIDGAWHDLDLSLIVPKIARAVLLIGHVEGNGVDWTMQFKKYAQTNDINHGGMETLRANVERCRMMIVAMDKNQKVQYKADNENWTTLDLAVRGWWT